MRKKLILLFLSAAAAFLTACEKGGDAKAAKEPDKTLYRQIMDKLEEARKSEAEQELPEWIPYTKSKYENGEEGKEFYYLYNEEYGTFDMFYLYGDTVIYCVSDGTRQQVTLADGERAGTVPWTIYCMQPGAYGLHIEGADLTGDGEEELLVKVTDEENNNLLYIFDLADWRDLSPYYSELFEYEDRDYSVERMYFYHEYGAKINEAINQAYSEKGMEAEREIPKEGEGVWFGLPELNHYSAYISGDFKMGLNYYCREWKCNILFAFTKEGCVIEKIRVQVYK